MITPGISLNGKQRSGLSSRRALIGILGSRASPGSCTIARPPTLFDSNEPSCPVATAPRQYDSDYARAIYARRRPEEWIGGRPRVVLPWTFVPLNETDRAHRP